MCESCIELIEVKERLKVEEIWGNNSGYFRPICAMTINYCPVCGKKLEQEKRINE